MHAEQKKSGTFDGVGDRLTPQRSPLNPPAAVRSGPLRKGNFQLVQSYLRMNGPAIYFGGK
jgi:hypothetical protein